MEEREEEEEEGSKVTPIIKEMKRGEYRAAPEPPSGMPPALAEA